MSYTLTTDNLDQLLMALGMKMDPGSVRKSYMRWMVDTTSPMYSCLRPPGAAGAMLISNGSIVMGYATSPVGDTCKDLGECEIENGHCVRTVHAEQYAILTAARFGITTSGARLYSVLKPCYQCTKAIILAGITHIYYAGAAYDEERTNKLLKLAGISCVHIDIGLNYGQELVKNDNL